MTRLIGGISGPLIILVSATLGAGATPATEGGRAADATAAASNPLDQLRRDAETGNVKAEYVLGCCYNGDHGFPRDPAKAAEWWGRAAAQGHAEAQFCLGLSCFLGEGVAKDAAEAVKWWRKAADQDQADAQYFLGLSYRTGLGIPRNMPQAIFWLKKSAGHGNKAAQGQLADIAASPG
jgi:TPR repeat protein